MLLWTIQVTVISIILIFLVHHLVQFFKNTLTVPKIKDLVNTPTQKYEDIYKIIQQSKGNEYNSNKIQSSSFSEYSPSDLLPKTNQPPQQNMKNELKNFLKSQMNK